MSNGENKAALPSGSHPCCLIKGSEESCSYKQHCLGPGTSLTPFHGIYFGKHWFPRKVYNLHNQMAWILDPFLQWP